jgi:hypothetical protein|tara:strand:+ start:1105 stop:1323 length:219 start_codon:yes stop_codon:yes gene_type:complete
MNLKKILMDRLDDELDELTDKALDKLMARTEDLERLADLLLQKGLGQVDAIVDAVVIRLQERLVEILSQDKR